MDHFCHKDWETVVLTKTKYSSKDELENKASIPKSSKQRLEKSEDIHIPDKVHLSLSKSIQQARNSKKMSQKQLAVMMNCQASLIQQYEIGQAIPQNNFICKLERVLKTKLPRKKKK